MRDFPLFSLFLHTLALRFLFLISTRITFHGYRDSLQISSINDAVPMNLMSNESIAIASYSLTSNGRKEQLQQLTGLATPRPFLCIR